jgi:hypothetical protein
MADKDKAAKYRTEIQQVSSIFDIFSVAVLVQMLSQYQSSCTQKATVSYIVRIFAL